MELMHCVFSQDGYIIRQDALKDVPFGGVSSRENGCGWIAAYNFLRAELRPVDWDTVRKDLSRSLLFHGKLGLNAFVLYGYLTSKGCTLHSACTLSAAKELTANCRTGLLMYETGKSRHFVAFHREADGKLRFWNARADAPDCLITIEEFCSRFVRFPVFWLFATRETPPALR